MFEPSNLLMKYLNASPRDMFDIIGALIGYINADPAFKSDDFDKAVEYVLEHGVTRQELFSEFNSSIKYEEDEDKWDEEYYAFATVCLKDNFSEKRIQHVKDIARKLYPQVISERKCDDLEQGNDISSTITGGQQSPGKKHQVQQPFGQSEQKTIAKQQNAKIIWLIPIVVFALLTLLIVAIIFFVRSKTDVQSDAASLEQTYKSMTVKMIQSVACTGPMGLNVNRNSKSAFIIS